MTSRELFRRSDIEDDDVFSPLQPPEQLHSRDRLQTVAGAEICVGQLADLRAVLGSHATQVAPHVEHLRILELVVDASSVAPPADKADLTQNLQVLTGICDGKSSLSRQPLNGPLAIGKDVDDLEPPAVRQRLCESSELVKEGGLRSSAVGLTRALACLRHVQLLGRQRSYALLSSL